MLTVTAHAGRPYAAHLRKHLRRALPMVPNAPRDLSVALVDDATMSALHLRHLGVAGPTDVLTFELDHDPSTGRCVGGEVVVCAPEAERQAALRGTSVANELLLYALHGALHLAGFDDRTDGPYRTMHRTEDDILTRVGVGPVFRPAKPLGRERSGPSARPVTRKTTRTRTPGRRSTTSKSAPTSSGSRSPQPRPAGAD